MARNPQTVVVQQQNTGDGTLRRIRVPILMYHYVSELPPAADQIREGLTVSPHLFNQHIQYLSENNYHTISLYDLDNALQFGVQLPENPIILTFDDGYIDHYINVFPTLQEFDFSGTFFVITAFVDNNNANYMSWSQIIEMANVGMSMEAHTKSHPDLRNRDYNFLVYEILGSIQSLESHTNRPSQMFAYPAGRYDDNLLSIMPTFPIHRAVTTQPGTLHTTDNTFELNRVRITNETTIPVLRHLLSQ